LREELGFHLSFRVWGTGRSRGGNRRRRSRRELSRTPCGSWEASFSARGRSSAPTRPMRTTTGTLR
jgi:hypothetical protein